MQAINKKDLRIENWIKFSEDATFCQVLSIEEHGMIVDFGGDDEEIAWVEYDHFEPIPLTQDILLKCGLEKYNNGWRNMSGTFMFMEYPKNNFYFDYGTRGHKVIIYHLHQLQNLIHSLTQTELTINL